VAQIETIRLRKELFCRSVQRSGRRHVGQLADGLGDPAPRRLTVEIVVRGEFVGARGAIRNADLTSRTSSRIASRSAA
jgi:hypothetical protein